ncbi:MAG: hypothetical protein ACP5IB_10500, partial [Thermoplasmata archaeon]
DVNGNQYTVSISINGMNVTNVNFVLVVPVVSQITNTLVYNFSYNNNTPYDITTTLTLYAISFVSDIPNKVYTIFFAPYNNSNSYTINFSQTLNSSFQFHFMDSDSLFLFSLILLPYADSYVYLIT